MFKLAMIFLAIASVSGVFAFSGIAAAMPGIAEIILSAFLAQLLIALAGWFLVRHRARGRMLGHGATPKLQTS